MSDGRRILLVMPRAPIPFGNADARWYYVLLRGLQERGFSVTAFASCASRHELEEARDLFPSPRYDLRCYEFPLRSGLWSKFESWRRPHSYMFSPELKRDLANVSHSGYDVLHLEQLWSGWLGLHDPERALVSIHHLASIDLSGAAVVEIGFSRDRWLALKAERILLPRFRHFRTLTKRLEDAVHAVNPTATITTVPIGIDLSLYPYIVDQQRTTAPVVSMIGSMDWYPSVSAARRLVTRLWPAIKREVPDAQLRLVGWKAREALKEFLTLPDVTVEENVESTHPHFSHAGVFLYAPERGTGMKIKILEALAFGVPVVTTSEGIEGFPADAQDCVAVSECDEGLVRKTVDLLRNRDLQNRQRELGRKLVEKVCSPGPTLDGMEAIYRKIVQSKRSN